jgi:hypothetical protein
VRYKMFLGFFYGSLRMFPVPVTHVFLNSSYSGWRVGWRLLGYCRVMVALSVGACGAHAPRGRLCTGPFGALCAALCALRARHSFRVIPLSLWRFWTFGPVLVATGATRHARARVFAARTQGSDRT